MSMIFGRRTLVQGLAVCALGARAGKAAQRPVPALTVYKDANCGCCKAWVAHVRAAGGFSVGIVDVPDLAATKVRLGVPAALAACHTGVVAGYLIEGHVPAADIARLLAARPAGVRGLAVPGMPAGSPGMEVPGGYKEPFDVLAFDAKGATRVFARHA